MLTISNVIKLYEEGVAIKFRKNKSKKKGEYIPSTSDVIIYARNTESTFDRDITILHELIHARDDIKDSRLDERHDEDVEKEAIKTYYKRPYIIEFVKQLYDIKK